MNVFGEEPLFAIAIIGVVIGVSYLIYSLVTTNKASRELREFIEELEQCVRDKESAE